MTQPDQEMTQDDIEDRLRIAARASASSVETCQLMEDAADRLASVAAIEAERGGLTASVAILNAQTERLADENARLRDALTNIDRRYRNGANADTLVWIARSAALAQQGEPST